MIALVAAAHAAPCTVKARLIADTADEAADVAALERRLGDAHLRGRVRLMAPLQLELQVRGELPALLVTQGSLVIAGDDGEIVPAGHVTAAEAGVDEDGRATVEVTLDAEGAARLAAGTAARVGQTVRLVLDGVTLVEPMIREPIPAGSLRVDAGDGSAEWTALAAAALRSPLTGAWTIERTDTIGRCR